MNGLFPPDRSSLGRITKFVLFIGPISSIFDYVTYFTMLYVFNAWNNPALFQTGWFVESMLTQTLIIHIIRTAKIPFLESRASTALITTTIIIAAIGIALPFTWLGGFLGFVPLPPAYWVRAVFYPAKLCHPDACREDMVHTTVRVELNGGFTMNHSPLLTNIAVWVGITFCISQSAVFSGLNLAIFSISKLRLEVEAAGGNRDAVGLLALREYLNLTLATVLWGMFTTTCSSRCCRIPSLPVSKRSLSRRSSSRCSARFFRKLIFREMRCAWRRGSRRC